MKQSTDQWSPEKRRKVTLTISVGILLVALGLGSIFYSFGRQVGVFQSQSIGNNVVELLAQDVEFNKIMSERFNKQTCFNRKYGIGLTFHPKVMKLIEDDQKKCLLFDLTSNPNPISHPIQIKDYAASRSQLINETAYHTFNPVIDTASHPRYPSTSIKGERDGIPYLAYIVEQSEAVSWLIEYYPANTTQDQSFQELMESIVFN